MQYLDVIYRNAFPGKQDTDNNKINTSDFASVGVYTFRPQRKRELRNT